MPIRTFISAHDDGAVAVWNMELQEACAGRTLGAPQCMAVVDREVNRLAALEYDWLAVDYKPDAARPDRVGSEGLT
jgi:hypothetical protein